MTKTKQVLSLEEKLDDKLVSKSLGTVEILGEKVNIREMKLKNGNYYCAFAEIENIHILTNKCFGKHFNYRIGDIIGIDSSQCPKGATDGEKLMFAIKQLEVVIKNLREIIGGYSSYIKDCHI